MKSTVPFFFCLLSLTVGWTAALGQDAPNPAQPTILPQQWLGVWKGEVKAESSRAKPTTFQMQLEIASHPDPKRLKWKLTYEGAQGKSERNYELVVEDAEAGKYVIDEGNGIRIATTRSVPPCCRTSP